MHLEQASVGQWFSVPKLDNVIWTEHSAYTLCCITSHNAVFLPYCFMKNVVCTFYLSQSVLGPKAESPTDHPQRNIPGGESGTRTRLGLGKPRR